MNKIAVKYFIFLNIILLLYSLSTIFSKLASSQQLFSFKFLLFYSLAIFTLFVYAICWQQILKKISLSTAFINKAITIVWGMVFGKIIFRESITVFMIIGSFVIFFGIYLVVTDCE